MSRKLAATAAIVTAGLVAHANAAVINFSNLGANGTEITADMLYGVESIVVDSNGSVDSLITFDTNLTGTADPDMEAAFDNPFTQEVEERRDFGYLAIIAENTNFSRPDDEARGGTVTFNFVSPVKLRQMAFIDTSGGQASLFGENGLISVFDIPEVDTHNNSPTNQFAILSFGAVAGVTSLQISIPSSGGFDNIRFNDQVPVPAALPLFLGGLGGIAVLQRRKKRVR